jgi:putative aldouronate transport system substrate-binding protein
MKKNRLISILLCMTILLIIGIGCTKIEQKTSKDSDSTQIDINKDQSKIITYDGSSPVSQETLTISWLCDYSGVAAQDVNIEDMVWVKEILRRANVKLDTEILTPSVYSDVVLPRLAAGKDLPDVIKLPKKDTDMSYIKSGIFADLTEMYEKYGYNLRERFKDNPTIPAQISTPEGKMYYVPVINMSLDYIPAISIQRRWLETLDLKTPETTDEFYNVMKSFKDNDPNGNKEKDEVPYLGEQLSRFTSLWGVNAAFYADKDGTVKYGGVTEGYKAYLTYWNKMYKEGLLYNEFASVTEDIKRKLLANDCIGALLTYPNVNLTYSQIIDPTYDYNNEKMILTPIDPPEGPYGDRFYWGNDPSSAHFAISRDCKNPEAVFCFLDYLYSEEANDLLYFGIEGEDYVIEGGEKVIDLEKRNIPDWAAKMGNNFGGFPRILLAIHRDMVYPPEVKINNERLRAFNRLPLLSTFYLADEIEAIQLYSADLNTYRSEMELSFITGIEDIEKFDDYVKTVENMGLKELTRVYQAINDRMSAISK